MKIIILGAKGMLGKALQAEFEKDNEVLAWDKNDFDVTNKNEIKNKLENIRPEIVINATAYNAVDKIEANSADYELAKQVNGYAVGYLAEVCKELNITLVHYSSDYVFKGNNMGGYTEEAHTYSINKYGETKILGEQELKFSGCKYYLIRISRLFGMAGESEHTKKSFVDLMIDLVEKQDKSELNLVDEELSCPTYNIDVAKFTRKLIVENQPFGIYHGTNDGACTWYGFAEEIFKLKNLNPKMNPVPSSKFPRPARLPAFSILLNTKMPKQRTWQEALRDYINN